MSGSGGRDRSKGGKHDAAGRPQALIGPDNALIGPRYALIGSQYALIGSQYALIGAEHALLRPSIAAAPPAAAVAPATTTWPPSPLSGPPGLEISFVNAEAEVRSFYPHTERRLGLGAEEKTRPGQITIGALVRGQPQGSTFRWDAPLVPVTAGTIVDPIQTRARAVSFATPTSPATRIYANVPGLHTVVFRVIHRGRDIARRHIALSVPQYVLVLEDQPSFDESLAVLGLLPFKRAFFERLRSRAVDYLSETNVRFRFVAGRVNEQLPRIPPITRNVMKAYLSGFNPTAGDDRQGFTADPVARDRFDEEIVVFMPRLLLAPKHPSSNEVITRRLAGLLRQAIPGTTDVLVEAFARYAAYILAHETVHALVAGVLSGGAHNQPPLESDLMNEEVGYVSAGVGLDRDGWVVLADEEKTFRLQPPNQALMNALLPVPPAFL